MPGHHPPVLAILGPTASGKSDLGMKVAAEVGGEIVNADALQVYRGLDIGTAKPTAEERRAVPHHLLDLLEPEERFSAGEFARLGRQAIAEIRRRGCLPIVVGGSGFYLQALFEGLSPLPPADPELRRQLAERAADEGVDVLHAELVAVDPATARRLPAADVQRVVRALEVALSTGRPLSQWIADRPAGRDPLPSVRIALTLPRALLYDRIASRVAQMLSQGWVEEVRGLLDRGLDPDAPAFQAIGYRQIVRHVRGDWDLDTAAAETVRATRRFAKRQLTWFRGDPEVRWFDPRQLSAGIPEVLELVQSHS
ncbi:MAG TPA: tRNA (adenosine(37)-N6)-dimethylallyltransferase MiaA [Thermoanaerobaculia bacterium]|nr:tRNA (adenosine(37)-N6)-dimethylallyltransferase MiaA [Thermoanaerobaculia bacterium]